MIESETERFGVRQMTYREIARHLAFTKNMMFAAIAVSVAIVALGALFVSLW